MHHKISLADIPVRNDLCPGDLGYIVYLHGSLYKREYDYGIEFESYVAGGLLEFYKQYDPSFDRVWICEHNDKIIGCLFLVHRSANTSQLRYFLIEPAFRGIGLGNKLMHLYLEFHHAHDYNSCYLWTTNEQKAAAFLYKKNGFLLTSEKPSTDFGKKVIEQRYDLI